MIVIDASVAAKWYLPEVGSQAALELQEGPDQLVAPDLIRLEVAGSITRRVRAEKKEERISRELALSRCGKWPGRQHAGQAVGQAAPGGTAHAV